MIKPWPVVRSTSVANHRIFQIRTDVKVSPRTGREHEFVILESVDWVNVIALTPQDELVMVEQYRHGTNSVELEIPGGIMDDPRESPEECGVRELREETGYEGGGARRLGTVFGNPAIMTNACHTILVERCHPVHEVDFDHGEDLVTLLVPMEEIPALVANGRIKHPHVVAALYFFELARRAGGG